MLFAAVTDHRYLQIGHVLDFANKAFEALDGGMVPCRVRACEPRSWTPERISPCPSAGSGNSLKSGMPKGPSASERVMTLRQKSIYYWSMQWYPKQIGVQFRPSENVHRGVWPQKHIAVLDDSPAMPFIRVVIDANSGSRQIG